MSIGGPDESDTCRDYVLPALHRVGWRDEQIVEQYPVQAELPTGRRPDALHRKRRADYVLELVPGLPLIVIEAKRLWAKPSDGIQQAIRYATKLSLPLALSTNGSGWELYNAATGNQSVAIDVPTPVEAWNLLVESRGLGDRAQQYLQLPFSRRLTNADGSVRQLRYYQRRAIHETLIAMAADQLRILLVMATGSGKTFTALQLVYKLWEYRRRMQFATGERNFRVLYLADRDVLVSEPWNRYFRPVFDEASIRLNTRNARHSPDIYFATYQALDTSMPEPGIDDEDDDSAGDAAEARDLLENYPPDFFDLVIVDECHRGSSRAASAWRQILEHFEPATQLGLTATPIERGEVDTFGYFGNPVFTYSLREGIEDGFLAPYTIRRVVFDIDADGFDVTPGLIDVHGAEITPGTYGTRDYERRLRLPDRTAAMARRIVDIIGDTADRAVVFCVDREHAATMVRELRNLRPDRTAADPEWACRIMSVERDKDRLLEQFLDTDRDIPQIAVTSSLLSTGVDIEDLKYVVIARSIGSMAEFKQIIGRGTRLFPDKGKTEFEIVDFVGATDKFRDPGFDGPPLKATETEHVDRDGTATDDGAAVGDLATDVSYEPGNEPGTITVNEPEPRYSTDDPGPENHGAGDGSSDDPLHRPRQVFELRGVAVELAAEGFWVHDVGRGTPRLVRYVDWAKQRVMERFEGPNDLLRAWADASSRENVIAFLRGARIDPARLTDEMDDGGTAPVDLVDRLLHLAWDTPTLTRAERARKAREEHAADLDALPLAAREVIDILLDRYAAAGIDEIASPEVVRVPPLSDLGTPAEIADRFGGAVQWHEARSTAQRWLFSA